MRRAQGLGAPLAVGVAVAGFTAAWRHYGIFDFADEGVLLAQAARVVRGEVPHVDFATGYGPLYFAVQAALLRAGGVEAIRLALAAAHGVAAALACALARRLAGGAAAAVAVALQVAFFLPVSARWGAPFNVPYPAWYAGVAGVVVAWLAAAPTPTRLLCAGLVAGTAAAMKLNSGVLLAMGAAVAAVVGDGGGGRPGAVGGAVLVLIGVAATLLVASTAMPLNGVVLAAPVWVLVAVAWRRSEPDARVVPRMLALVVGAVVVAGSAYAPALATLGPGRFAREVLLLGSGAAGAYELPFPWAAVPLVALGLTIVVRGPGSRRWATALGVGAVVVLALAWGTGAAAAGRRLTEQALLALAPLVGVAAVLRGRSVAGLLPPAAVVVAGVLQLFPRPVFAHLLPLGPLVVPLLTALPRPACARWALSALALGAAVRFAPTVPLLAHLATGRVAGVSVGAVPFTVDEAGAPRLRALAETVADVTARTPPDAAVLSFPACAAVAFFAGRRPLGQHDYFFPGRPDHADVEELLRALSPAPPAVAVTCTGEESQLAGAWAYFPEMAAFLDQRYRVVAVHSPFDVREARP